MPDADNSDPMLSFDQHSTTRNQCTAHKYRNEAIRPTRCGHGRTFLRIIRKSNSRLTSAYGKKQTFIVATLRSHGPLTALDWTQKS